MTPPERDRRPWARPGQQPRSADRTTGQAEPTDAPEAPPASSTPPAGTTDPVHPSGEGRSAKRAGAPTHRPSARPSRRRDRSSRATSRARPTWSGTWTVAATEVQTAVFDVRRLIALAVWVAAVYGLFALAWSATANGAAGGRGGVIHGLTTFATLGMGLVVAPALTATALSSARRRRTLETWQTSLLTPAEIGLGLLGGAAALIAAVLVLVFPTWLAALAADGIGVGGLIAAVLLVGVCLLTAAAVGLACSARLPGTVTSLAVSYLVIGALVFALPALFAVATGATQRPADRSVTVADPSDLLGARCVTTTQQRPTTHAEFTWWILAPNPFVVVADAAPARRDSGGTSPLDPLTAIHDAVRAARRGDADVPIVECTPDPARSASAPSAAAAPGGTATGAGPSSPAASNTQPGGATTPTGQTSGRTPEVEATPQGGNSSAADGATTTAHSDATGPVWPYGLIVLLGVTAACAWEAIRALRTPTTRARRPLPRAGADDGTAADDPDD